MNIIVIGGEKEYWQDVFLSLEKKGINIHSALTHYYHDNKGPRKFYNSFDGNIIDGLKLFNSQELSKIMPKDPVTLDKEKIDFFTSIERDFYIMTDRFAYLPISMRERKRVFRDNLRFWLTYFRDNKIDALFSPITPHSLSDFSCYHVAKYLGIPTLNVAHTAINDHVFIRQDYRERKRVPQDYLRGKSEEEIISEIPEFLWNKAFKEMSNNTKFVLKRNDQVTGTENLKESAEIEKKDMRKSRRPFILFKPAFKAAFAMNGLYSPLSRKFFKLREKLWLKKQQRLHDKVMTKVDLTKKYVYFAMHYQPEQTSCPETEVFEDQLLAIEILSKSLPEGWKLYVKENPVQFCDKCNMFTGRHARDFTDYQNILRLRNVEIIDPSIPNNDILENAQIVTTLAGTVGWEAINKGKPAIIFANSWYSACRSVFEVDSVKSTKEAIEKAQKKTEDEIHLDVVKYLHFMKDEYFAGHIGDHHTIAYVSLGWEEMVESMAQRLSIEFSQLESESKNAA